MILIAIGANLPSRFGTPQESCTEAVRRLRGKGLSVVARSFWYESPPLPLADQPWYVNGVVCVETSLGPEHLLAALHGIEAAMGRIRTVANAPRVIDLDLVAYHDRIVEPRKAGGLCLPHPRLRERAFVLVPLGDIAKGWSHPKTGESLDQMVASLPKGQTIRRLETDIPR